MKQNKIYSLLGLATRSRNLVSGEFMTETKIKHGEAELVIVGEMLLKIRKKSFAICVNFTRSPYFAMEPRKNWGGP